MNTPSFNRAGPCRVNPVLPLLGVTLLLTLPSRAQEATLVVRPTQPWSLAVEVAAGSVTLPDGMAVTVAAQRLEVEPPEIVRVEALDRRGERPRPPQNFGSYYERWDPWPTGRPSEPAVIRLTPPRDAGGTMILGDWYRCWRSETLTVTDGADRTFVAGQDFRFNEDWGQIANVNGRLGEPIAGPPVHASIEQALVRVDLLQVGPGGALRVKRGTSVGSDPAPVQPDAGWVAVANLLVAPWRTVQNPWIKAGERGLAGATEYAITPTEILPVRPRVDPPVLSPGALDGTLAKLRAGGQVKVAFLGDSITEGAEATGWYIDTRAYTARDLTFRGQLIDGLRQRFPEAVLLPVAGYRGGATLANAADLWSEQVLPQKPDLVVVAFGGNDVDGPLAGDPRTPLPDFRRRMAELVRDIRLSGAEVLLVAPMPLSPFLKNGARERQPAYHAVLQDMARTGIAAYAPVFEAFLAETAAGWPDHLFLRNGKNHPGDRGHAIYARTILRVFDEAATRPPAAVAESVPEVVDDGVFRLRPVQPRQIPGTWALGPQPLPPLAEIVARPRTRLPVYGIYCWANEYVQFRDVIRTIGWRTLRIGGPLSDAAMRAIVEDDIEVMVTLSARIHGTFAENPMGVWRNRADYPSDEAFVQDYLLGVERFLERFGPGGTFFRDHPDLPVRPVRFVEIFNEPNFWYLDTAREDRANHNPPSDRAAREAQEASRQKLYGQMLVAAAARIRERFPDVRIVGFAAGGISRADVPFIVAVHERNREVGRSYDILSTHPYVRPAPPEADMVRSWGSYSIARGLVEIRDVMRRHGAGDRPIWYTELSWTVQGGRFEPGADRNTTPELQAAHFVRGYLWALRLGVERVNYMSLVDTDGVNAGMLAGARGEEWRPAAHAIRALLALMPHPRLIGAVREGRDGIYGYVYQSGRSELPERVGDVLAFWKVDGPDVIELPWPQASSVTLMDYLGETYQAPVVEGKVRFEIGPLPVYVLR